MDLSIILKMAIFQTKGITQVYMQHLKFLEKVKQI